MAPRAAISRRHRHSDRGIQKSARFTASENNRPWSAGVRENADRAISRGSLRDTLRSRENINFRRDPETGKHMCLFAKKDVSRTVRCVRISRNDLGNKINIRSDSKVDDIETAKSDCEGRQDDFKDTTKDDTRERDREEQVGERKEKEAVVKKLQDQLDEIRASMAANNGRLDDIVLTKLLKYSCKHIAGFSAFLMTFVTTFRAFGRGGRRSITSLVAFIFRVVIVITPKMCCI